MLGNTRQHSHTLKREQTNTDTLEHAEAHSNNLRAHSTTLKYTPAQWTTFTPIRQHSGKLGNTAACWHTHGHTRQHSHAFNNIGHIGTLSNTLRDTGGQKQTHVDTLYLTAAC